MTDTSQTGNTPPRTTRRTWPRDALAALWLLIIGMAVLLPAFVHGTHIGSYDLLSQQGLSQRSGVTIHNTEGGDQINSMLPWSTLVWRQVHGGHLPLWNPYNGLGLPLAFNWQSAPFALPALVGYLFPLQYAYNAGLVVTLLVAGSGLYFLGRTLGLGRLASVFAGTVFELSGPLTGWLGFPHGAVMSWGGWVFGASLVLTRAPRRRALAIAFLAVCLAFLVYSGQPEVVAVFLVSLAGFVLIVLLLRIRGGGALVRPLIDLVLGSVAGLALAAPLALPGAQAVSESVRGSAKNGGAMPAKDLMYLISQGFDGLPIHGSVPFGMSVFYNESAAFVGSIAVVLAIAGVALQWRRPPIVGLAAIALGSLALAFTGPLAKLWSKLPVLSAANSTRALMPLALAIAGLAGVGVEQLVRHHRDAKVRAWIGGTFSLGGIGLALMYLFGRGDLPPMVGDRQVRGSFLSMLASLRSHSFVGPALGIIAGLVTIGVLDVIDRKGLLRRRRIPAQRVGLVAALILLLTETGLLLSSAAPIFSSSSAFFPTTPAEMALRQSVGTGLVGFGSGWPYCSNLGIEPSVNDVYEVRELNAYDPIVPKHYFDSWLAVTRTNPGARGLNLFCPKIASVEEARTFGVSYLLEMRGTAAPPGTVYVRSLADERLYRVPDSGRATVTPLASTRSGRSVGGSQLVAVSFPDPSSWVVHTASSQPELLQLRLSNVPGWHASIDGRPLAVRQFDGMMLQADIPPGRHVIVLRYWPTAFTVGIVIALVAGITLVAAVAVEHRRLRRRLNPDGGDGKLRGDPTDSRWRAPIDRVAPQPADVLAPQS